MRKKTREKWGGGKKGHSYQTLEHGEAICAESYSILVRDALLFLLTLESTQTPCWEIGLISPMTGNMTLGLVAVLVRITEDTGKVIRQFKKNKKIKKSRLHRSEEKILLKNFFDSQQSLLQECSRYQIGQLQSEERRSRADEIRTGLTS